MVLIDSNSLILLILGSIDKNLINTHEKTSIYEVEDYENLVALIGDISNVIVLPNILTEVDNLLNKFKGERRYKFVLSMIELASKSTEMYLESLDGIKSDFYTDLGLTDSLILKMKEHYNLLITSDTKLSDRAHSLGIDYFDLKAFRQLRF
jgi:rRNA-processing protein FCF1